MKNTKTDNSNLWAKIALRRWFLKKYHRQGVPTVFDCCSGSGKIWNVLRKDFVCRYMATDLSPRRAGAIKVESSRIFDIPGWTFDVIDIDTYGEPWRHYEKICNTAANSLTVFLTVGSVTAFGGHCSKYIYKALGLPDDTPSTLAVQVGREMMDRLIWFPLGRLQLAECREIPTDGNVRYIGLRLEFTQKK
jgi:hypothetical protein